MSDGASDDVAFVWVLVHLGIGANSPDRSGPPTVSEVERAFVVLDRLSQLGLVDVGKMSYIDGGPSGRVAPVKHVREPLPDVRERVLAAVVGGGDWEFSCWVISTPAGVALAAQG